MVYFVSAATAFHTVLVLQARCQCTASSDGCSYSLDSSQLAGDLKLFIVRKRDDAVQVTT